ncbi:unnamed protein product [Fraxinus pennsylvanica]|uniref:C2 domain-containing protein n=1 Tax=Fraxinus pennsylvanica TaxID=56036 RepID=A0AAD2EA87_9LAMI|nr:unnamed protein product [Fraxinus pennsylvanica]
MVRGTLEVLLVSAKGLENTDFLSNMDPYVIITCRTQEHKSSVASGKGSDPEWNETFVFALSDDVPELSIKIMDSDNTSDDDFVGEAKIPLEGLFTEGSIPPTAYNVVKDEEYCGEIRVGLRFTPEASREEMFDAQLRGMERVFILKLICYISLAMNDLIFILIFVRTTQINWQSHQVLFDVVLEWFVSDMIYVVRGCTKF